MRVPVYWRTNPGGPLLDRELYTASIVTACVERATLEELKEAVVAAIAGMVRDRELPVYVLRCGGRDVAVYRRSSSGFLAELADGTGVSECDLPSLRAKADGGIVAGHPLLFVMGVAVFRVSSSSLTLELPAAVFTDIAGAVWIPVFNVERGALVAEAPDGSFHREAHGDAPSALLGLYDEVAAALVERGALAEMGAFLGTAVPEAMQKALAGALPAADFALAYTHEQQGISVHKTFPVVHWQGGVLALVNTPEAGGLLVRGNDRWTLQDRAGETLEALGVLPSRDRLVVEAA